MVSINYNHKHGKFDATCTQILIDPLRQSPIACTVDVNYQCYPLSDVDTDPNFRARLSETSSKRVGLQDSGDNLR